ncbi:MAG: VacJ family lipoprotein [Rhodospirillaceae bacterium]|nr:VacJ family lipoprotein [Rhodospirillaceae bacterium]
MLIKYTEANDTETSDTEAPGHHTSTANRPVQRRPVRTLVRVGAVLALSAFLWGCAAGSASMDPETRAEQIEANDPLEPVNRVIFQVNRGLDTWFLKPAATFYQAMLPPQIQTAFSNFLDNLNSPVVLLNDILQGDSDRATNTFARFAINTTIGIGGLFDMAADMGYPDHSEDFGQTLGIWGIDEGPYIMLPIFGPSNPRDTVGLVADYFTDPITNWAINTDRRWVNPTRSGSESVDFRARNMEEIDDTERTSIDYYATVRSLYRQHRRDQIRNGEPNSMPTISGMPAMDMPDMEDPDGMSTSASATRN